MVTKRHTKRKKNTTRRTSIQSFYKTPPKILNINGYFLLLLPIAGSKATQMECSVFGGNFLENEQNSGIAHLTEHVVVNGSNQCGDKSCIEYLDKHGIQYNATTHINHTNYWLKGLPIFNDTMFEYLTSIIFSPIITEKRIAQEKKAVYNELTTNMNDPAWKLSNIIIKNLYKSVGLQNNGNIALQLNILNKLKANDIYNYINLTLKKYCVLFTISGKFEKQKIINNFKRVTLPHKKKVFSIKNIKYKCYTFSKKVIFVKNNKAKNTNINIVFPIDIKQGDKCGIYLEFLSSILGNGLNSILLKRLREELNIVYGLRVVTNIGICGSTLYITTSTKDDNVKKVLDEIFNILKHFKTHTIPIEQLKNEKLKFKLKMSQLYISNPNTVSKFYTNQFFWQINKKVRKIWTLNEVITNIERLSTGTLTGLMKKIFDTNKCIVGYIGKKNVGFSTNDY
tara:strand:- start:7345 stop:8703 length:1359 start_codon:yes stop_codon:yes gene_type:complete